MRPEHVGDLSCAAASGLWLDASRLYVVADDGLDLEVYGRGELNRSPPQGAGGGSCQLNRSPPQGAGGGSCQLQLLERHALAPGTLPADPVARKAAKRDFEILVALPGGPLLAMGSGSRPLRRLAVAWTPGAAEVRPCDFEALYLALEAEVPDLNLEGAAPCGDALRLLQRGNGARGRNLLIDLDLAAVTEAVARGRPVGPELIRRTIPVALGERAGVALGFTDATPAGDELLFSAVAEATDSTYFDGALAGAALGRLDREGRLIDLAPLEGGLKVEGLHLEGEVLWMVADADDPAVPAPVLRLPWPAALGRATS